MNRLRNVRVVAEVLTPEGETTLVDVAVRERDLMDEIVLLLLEKASGDYSSEPLHSDFDHSDALGG